MENRSLQENLLIISGSGRRTGKTTLACAIIRHFSELCPLIAIKISPHANHNAGLAELLFEKNGFKLYEETAPNSKDSGLFLESGALKSYFLEVTDHNIDIAWDYVSRTLLNPEQAIVCESGYLGHLIKPGLMIFCGPDNPMMPPSKQRNKALSDLALTAGQFDVETLLKRITFTENKWVLHPSASE